MKSRGRSIRLRIYFLVAIPLITMLGLFGYVAYTSITNYTNLDRAPGLIKATSIPLTHFVSFLQAERRAAVVYLSNPNSTNLTAYKATAEATGKAALSIEGTVNSSAVKDSTTPAETAAINTMISDVMGMGTLRSRILSRKLSAFDAFQGYTEVIIDQDTVFRSQANSMTDTVASLGGFGLISTVNAREDVSEQDALLAGAFAAGSLTTQERVAFSDAVGRQTDDTLLFQTLLTAPELKVFNTVMDTQAPLALQDDLTQVQQGVESGLSLAALELKGLSPASWQQLTEIWQTANYEAGTAAATAVLAVDQGLADNAKNRVWETAAVGAVGLILTLMVTILLARSINRRLTRLRLSALELANRHLPAVVARLRQGEAVDVTAEAAPILVGSDEIGQVGQAIDAVRQSAIRSAVEAAEQTRLRLGINEMFRNLARRSQSLLQRQLSVLDEMEHRVTDPEVLEEIDHLTTRMRRHAEGLIILSGTAPGRSWSAPVKLVDVMRGAVAEIQDYARVTVSTQSCAALAGSAVTDVIHLLAELIENAATLSPPFTQVRVGGDSAAHGFAIEIEDSGLGMSPRRLAELNDRIANPPELSPANTGQLGLIVVGQLARRHGISVTLRPSPHGGTTAVALIPRTLLVEDGPAVLTTGGPEASDNDQRTSNGWSGQNGWSQTNGDQTGSASPTSPTRSTGPVPASSELRQPGALPSRVRATGAHRAAPTARMPAAPAPAETGPHLARRGPDDVPVVTGVPVGRPTGSPAGSPGTPFDVFNPIQPASLAPAVYEVSYPDFGPEASGASYATPASGLGNSGGAADGYDGGQAGDDYKGLPRRVRQASIAPELRASAAAPDGPGGDLVASAKSLAVMRNTLSAMQRGWQQGRSESQGDTEGTVSGG
jgi:signal transduction histidine kinase